MRAIHPCAILALLWAALPSAAAEPAAGATPLPGIQWDELTLAVRAIESATQPSEAMAAYAKGCGINRLSEKLQKAYLRKMLQFGRPDVAVYPAKALTEIDPRDGMAWGVLAYRSLKGKQYMAALPYALKAVAYAPENPSICRNAAQLVTWYENGRRPPLSAEARSLLSRVKSGSEYGKFKAALATAKQGLSQLARDRDRKKKEADQAAAEARQIEQKYEQIRAKLRTVGRSYESARRRMEDARREVSRAEDAMYRGRDYHSRRSAEQRRDSAARSYRRARDEAAKHLREGKKIREEVDKLEKEYEAKKARSERLLREANAVSEGMPSSYVFEPPAVDGVVTPDATIRTAKAGKPPRKPSGGGGSYLAPARPAGGKPAAAPARPLGELLVEAEAADKLSLAKICMDSKDAAMQAKARALLTEILSKYPTSKAAGEAKQLMGKLK